MRPASRSWKTAGIRSNVVASQLVHQDTGGIVPEVAAREHLRVLDALTEKALRDAGRDLTEIDAVAATVGPGLIGCLLVGANYGRGLALAAGLPFVGVNHLEGHVYANWLYELEGGEPPSDPPSCSVLGSSSMTISRLRIFSRNSSGSSASALRTSRAKRARRRSDMPAL